MHYTIHQLRIFQKVAQTGSITKAAEALHLTQPAVSIQLKNLQEQFEIPLTEVVGRKLFITEFGKAIAETTDNILNQIDAINYQVAAHKGLMGGKLKISVVSTGQYVMPSFISGFLNQHPGIALKLDVTNKYKVIESLENNEVDFSLVSVLPEQLQIEKTELLQNKLYLVGNKSRVFDKKMYDKNIFETISLIYREQGSGTRQTMERFIKQHRLPVIKKMELTSNEAVKQAVIAGMGYSIMPLIGIKNELINGELQIVPVKGFPIKSTWNLIWLKGKNHSPVAQAYLQFLKKEKINIINSDFGWFERYK